MDDWILAAGALSVALVAIAALLRAAWQIYRRFDAFFDDWFGQPARPGRAAVPGIAERVGSLEDDMAAVKRQVTPNGGTTTSLGDRAVRIERALGTGPDSKEQR